MVPHFYPKSGGWGLKSINAIKKGDFIIEYVGEVIMSADLSEVRDHDYLLRVEGNFYIYSEKKGNLSRFLRHCCTPNTCLEKW